MKKKHRFTVTVQSFFSVYAVGAFVSWQWNPLQWKLGGQITAVIVIILLMVIIHGSPNDPDLERPDRKVHS